MPSGEGRAKGEANNSLDRMHAKHDRPQELHHAPALRIALPRLHDPVAERDIIRPWALTDPLPAHCELRAARGGDFLAAGDVVRLFVLRRRKKGRWRRHVGENLAPDLRRDVFVRPVRGQAAGVPVAAEIHVAVLLHEGDLQGVQRGDVGVQGRVGVPGGEEAGGVGVQEREGAGERGVVVDDVGEVGHAFVAFVEGRG